MSDSDSHIKIENLWKVFGDKPERALHESQLKRTRSEIQADLDLVVALKDVSFEVNPGETFVVMGLSGSGKSTLVRCLIRLIDPTSGKVVVDNEDVTAYGHDQLRDFRRTKISMVFQHFGLLPHKNVLDNAAYGLEVRGVSKDDRHQSATDMLELVGLQGWEQSDVRHLSGGMQQRVGLARALASEPEILLMDEPFSGLDPLIRRQMRKELTALQTEINKTIVFITHDLDEAITVGDRIAIMRDGEIIQLGTPKEIILDPVDEFVSEFTEGIPKTRVLDLGMIARTPDMIFDSSRGAETLIAELQQGKHEHAVCIRNDKTVEGIITLASFAEPDGSSETKMRALLSDNGYCVNASTCLEDALPIIAEDGLSIAVVDDEKHLVGVVTQHDILRALSTSSIR